MLYMLYLVLLQTVSSQLLSEASTSRLLKRFERFEDDLFLIRKTLKEESDIFREDISTLFTELRNLRKDLDDERQLRRGDISTVSNWLSESSRHVVSNDKGPITIAQHGSCDCDAIAGQYRNLINAFKSEKSENIILKKKFDEMKKEHDFEIDNLREMFNNSVSEINSTDIALRLEIDTIKNEAIDNTFSRENFVNIILQQKFDELRKNYDFEIGNVRETLENVNARLDSADRRLRSEIDTMKLEAHANLSATQKLVHNSYSVCHKEINHTRSYFNDGLMRVNESFTNRFLNAIQDISRMTSDIVNLNMSNEILKNLNNLTDSCDSVEKNGEHKIYPRSHPNGIRVYCNKESTNKGWIVIQRRADMSVNFNRTWVDYKTGFGNLSGEFWLGNEHIFKLTKDKPRELRIDINIGEQYALYSNFSISSESEKYKLHLSGYSGDARDGLGYHSGMSFSTFDADYDNMMQACCACDVGGGWWYRSDDCFKTNLNGNRPDQFGRGVRRGFMWWAWRRFGGLYGGNFLLSSSMSIR
ncbi:hypothetical protein DPMN_145470 [Dreissena polymorpha]|uniref:Fibrinogen C-terminal domain-containing protein n=2 Tax=Dreissena polymorpha TaxID=45954 RepID=A0A9D4F8G9_DREPO|nr:hypothetical protein DPMN_145470 [Dreissena polymorpha]